MASKSLELFLVGRDLSASKALKGLGNDLDKTAASGTKMGSVLKVGLAAGAAAAVALGVSAIHMASQFQDAEARLDGAVTNVGGNFDQLKPKVEDLDSKMAKLGFTGTDVESSLAGLVTATKDPTKAIGLMGLAADIARGRNIDLATATNILVKVETGHVGLLGRLGIATKDATGKTISQDEAVKRLSDLYGGDAQRSADTFAGKLRALKAEGEDLAVKVGMVLIPVVSTLATILLDSVGAVSSVVHWFKQNEAAAAALGAVLTVALLPAMARMTASAVKFVLVNVSNAFILAADGALQFAEGATAAQLAMGPIAVIAAAATFVVVKSWQSQTEAINAGKRSADDYAGSLIKSKTSVDTMQSAVNQLTNKLGEQVQVTVAASRSGNILSNNFMKQFAAAGELYKQLETLKAQEATIATNQLALARAYHLSTAQVETFASVNGVDLTQSLDVVTGAFGAAWRATQATHKPMSQAAIDFKKVGDKSLTASEQVKALKDAFDNLIGKSVDAHEATVTFYNDLATLSQKLKDSKGSMDLETQAGRDASSAFSQLVKDTGDVSAAQKDANYSTATMKKTLDAEIAALEKAGGNSSYARGEIAKLKAEEDALYPAVRAVNDALNSVPSNPYSGVHVPSTSGLASSKYYADGGWVDAPPGQPQNAVVHGGEFVLSRKMLAGMRDTGPTAAVHHSAGNTYLTVNVNGVVGNPTEVAKTVARELKRLTVNGATLN